VDDSITKDICYCWGVFQQHTPRTVPKILSLSEDHLFPLLIGSGRFKIFIGITMQLSGKPSRIASLLVITLPDVRDRSSLRNTFTFFILGNVALFMVFIFSFDFLIWWIIYAKFLPINFLIVSKHYKIIKSRVFNW